MIQSYVMKRTVTQFTCNNMVNASFSTFSALISSNFWPYMLSTSICIIYSYIDDVLSINNPDFENYLGQIYLVMFEIRDTTEGTTSICVLPRFTTVDR